MGKPFEPGPKQPVVWHLSSNRWNSAITEYALSCARAFELLGWRSVFSPLKGSPAETRLKETQMSQPMQVLAFESFHPIAGLGKFRQGLRELSPSIVIAYGGPETFLTKICRPKGLVWRFHGQRLHEREHEHKHGYAHALQKKVRQQRFRLSCGHVDRVLSPSETLAREIRPLSHQTPVCSVPLGCDRQRFFWKPRSEESRDRPRPRAILLGRLDPVKGHRVLIEMFAKLHQRWGDLRGDDTNSNSNSDNGPPSLTILGEAANISSKEIQRWVETCGLTFGDDVVLIDRRVEDLPELLRQMDLGIVASLGSEVICRVAQEFLLCGLPVLVSGVGSLDEVLFEGAGHSYAGLSQADTEKLLAASLLAASGEDDTVRQKRAELAKTKFSMEAMAEELRDLLK